MFGSLGFPEILLILVLALLIFGPKRLPEVGRTIGKGLSEFRRASSDLKRTVNVELALDEDERPATSRRPEIGPANAKPAARAPAPDDLGAPAVAPPATAPRTGGSSSTEPPVSEEAAPPVPAEEEPEAVKTEAQEEPADEPATTTHQ